VVLGLHIREKQMLLVSPLIEQVIKVQKLSGEWSKNSSVYVGRIE